MGLNVDLIPMLDVPATVGCPSCEKSIQTGFDDYDIECGEINPEPGLWKLHVYCSHCEHEFYFMYRLNTQLAAIQPCEDKMDI